MASGQLFQETHPQILMHQQPCAGNGPPGQRRGDAEGRRGAERHVPGEVEGGDGREAAAEPARGARFGGPFRPAPWPGHPDVHTTSDDTLAPCSAACVAVCVASLPKPSLPPAHLAGLCGYPPRSSCSRC